MKICPKCGSEKSHNEFFKNKSSQDGFSYWCKKCNKEYRSKKWKEDPTKDKQRFKNWSLKNPWNMRERAWKKYGIKNPDGSNFKWADYLRLLDWQNNSCYICEVKDSGKNDWHVDHNHRTGIVRGILCRNCNIILGVLKTTENLKRCIEYLESFGE